MGIILSLPPPLRPLHPMPKTWNWIWTKTELSLKRGCQHSKTYYWKKNQNKICNPCVSANTSVLMPMFPFSVQFFCFHGTISCFFSTDKLRKQRCITNNAQINENELLLILHNLFYSILNLTSFKFMYVNWCKIAS